MFVQDIEEAVGKGRSRLRHDRSFAKKVYDADDYIQNQLNVEVNKPGLPNTGTFTRYYALYHGAAKKSNQLNLFAEEGNSADYLSRVFGIYNASVALTNEFADDSLEELIQKYEGPINGLKIANDILQGLSDYSLIDNIRKGIYEVPKNGNAKLNLFNLYSYFDEVRKTAKNKITSSTKQETLEKIEQVMFKCNGFDFHDKSAKRKFREKNAPEKSSGKMSWKESMEKLPAELPEYTPIYRNANLSEVIGNVEGTKRLLTSAHQVVDYNPVTKSNPFEGAGFHQYILLHGMQGSGKNFTIDAVLNSVAKEAKNYGIELKVIDLKKDLRSSYRERNSIVLRHFATKQLQENEFYINIINEADGVFGVDSKGQSHEDTNKLISDAKEVMDMTKGKNVAWWLVSNNPGVFEAALGDRVLSVEMPGARSAEEYKRLFQLKLDEAVKAGKCNLNENQWEQVVKHYFKKTGKNDSQGVYFSGRSVSDICETFASFDVNNYLENRAKIHQASYEQKRDKIRELMPEVTVQRLLESIDNYVNNERQKHIMQDNYRKQHE